MIRVNDYLMLTTNNSGLYVEQYNYYDLKNLSGSPGDR